MLNVHQKGMFDLQARSPAPRSEEDPVIEAESGKGEEAASGIVVPNLLGPPPPAATPSAP